MWEITWFILIGVFFAGYSVLDGFDLGIGLVRHAEREPGLVADSGQDGAQIHMAQV